MDGLAPWHWRSQPLSHRRGSEVFAALFAHLPIATLLESPHSHPLARFSICAGGPRESKGDLRLWTPPLGEILPFLQRLSDLGMVPNCDSGPEQLPFYGGWLGWLGYDLAWEIEQLPRLKPDPLPFPVAFWYEPEAFAILDHHQQTLWLATTHPQQLDGFERRLETSPPQSVQSAFGVSDIHFLTSETEYTAMVRQALAHIQAGDIFQANLSTRFCVNAKVDPWHLYQTLQRINPSPFASFWRTPWGSVVSCSPERLVSLNKIQAETRPIAGTRARGVTPIQDENLAAALVNSTKEIAEHTMLVDLERNDLGRVCQWGSVEVNEFLALEYYSHVIHLVSNITGTLNPSFSGVDLIRSMFPGGTITGCPKVRCMEIIEQLEPYRRSLFYGSCGYLDRRGHLDLNILIRTVLVTSPPSSPSETLNSAPNSIIWGQVGAGIVADSNPKLEWLESLQKAKAQIRAIQEMGKQTLG
ncbi:anthranilate synthase component I [Acaryochloris sp. IP29b_bin.137]|uniref:anthranilate synthase component I n=1 Tax=Acaryochloris sp. IP29b_bin.137 TaxID=2969217 RepID=UPI002610A8E7|nr:anthranilate synthase component I [Acaryochloris sp. IP29b_bin.137]